MAANKFWTEEEDLLLLQYADGRHWAKLAKLFPDRTPDACRRRHDLIKSIVASGIDDDVNRHISRINQDKAFQVAMRVAIQDGHEKAPIGVYVAPDADNWAPRYFPRLVQYRSYLGSPAAECASLAS